MKLILTTYKDHTEVSVRDNTGINLHTYTFDTKGLAEAFLTGFRCCQAVANSVIQSIPTTHEIVKNNG